MDVQRKITRTFDYLHNGGSKSQVGDVVTVHHVEMEPIDEGCNRLDLVFEAAEIGREDRGRELESPRHDLIRTCILIQPHTSRGIGSGHSALPFDLDVG